MHDKTGVLIFTFFDGVIVKLYIYNVISMTEAHSSTYTFCMSVHTFY